jgi:diguanylate cyclase (GGDEF)-like protein
MPNTANHAAVRILIVDDDQHTLEVAREALSSPDLEVVAAHSAAEAEALLEGQTVNLILLGLVLPDADGRSVLQRLGERAPTATVPVMMLAEEIGPTPREECIGLGVADFITKPVNPESLANAIAATLERVSSEHPSPVRDPVTGLANRAAFLDRFMTDVTERARSGQRSAMALLDVDGLAQINAAWGSTTGDQVLTLIGRTIAELIRDHDMIARWREDEFAVLLPGMELNTAARLLAKAQAVLTTSPLTVSDDVELTATFCAGITTAASGATVQDVIAQAERALVHAKRRGVSHVVTSEEEFPDEPASVLIAEDDRVSAALVRHRMERAGLTVIHRENGAEALAAAKEHTVDLFILDIRMPRMDGFELLRSLRALAQYADTPILMLTSLGREEDIVRAFHLGASDYVTKPFSPVELLARVQRLLRSHASTRRR